MYINKSLCFLEQVVLALADRRRDHVPFRQSKLTACLKDSIGGNCNTRLIANVWAEAAQIEETVSYRPRRRFGNWTTRGYANSRMPTRGLDKSRTGQLAVS